MTPKNENKNKNKKQIRRLRAALPPALDVGAMVAAFPGLACMDVGSNVRLKVRTYKD